VNETPKQRRRRRMMLSRKTELKAGERDQSSKDDKQMSGEVYI
jgi:hypothetical protein